MDTQVRESVPPVRERVLVTGAGVIAPCGVGRQRFWEGLQRVPEPGRIREARDFTPGIRGQTPAEVKRQARFTQFALTAAHEALADAGLTGAADAAGLLTGADPARVGVFIGNSSGGNAERAEQEILFDRRGRSAVSPLSVPKVMPNAAGAAVSIHWGLRGPCETVSTACASGTHSLVNAAAAIASGRLDVAVAGGAESALTGASPAAYENMRALSRSGHCRPFDTGRDGFVLGEGAGLLVLESARHAAGRGAGAYAELAGGASNADAHHITAAHPEGSGALECMRMALRDAGVIPEDVTHLNAHGTATRANDAAEATAVASLFGGRPAVSATKGVTGHGLGAAGGIEAVALALSYERRALPPTLGTVTVDKDFAIDVVLEPRPWEPAAALSNSFGFGGHNGTVVFLPH